LAASVFTEQHAVRARLSLHALTLIAVELKVDWRATDAYRDTSSISVWRERRYELTEPLVLPEARVRWHRSDQGGSALVRIEVPYVGAAIAGTAMLLLARWIGRPRPVGFPLIQTPEHEAEACADASTPNE
jgi:hypothetical protein